MRLKYVLRPGYFTTPGGRTLYVGAHQLAQGYRVEIRECLVVSPTLAGPEYQHLVAGAKSLGLIDLRPRSDGNYELPSPAATPDQSKYRDEDGDVRIEVQSQGPDSASVRVYGASPDNWRAMSEWIGQELQRMRDSTKEPQ